MKLNKLIYVLVISILISGCTDEFLKPKPLSILTTEAGLVNSTSMYAVLSSSTRLIRNQYMDGTFAPPMFTEYLFTEVMIDGTTDKTFPTRDMNRLVILMGFLQMQVTIELGTAGITLMRD